MNTLAFDINNRGQIVGAADGSDTAFAFLYSQGKMTHLNPCIDPASGWNLLVATAIDDSGRIVCLATKASGENPHVLLLTPESKYHQERTGTR